MENQLSQAEALNGETIETQNQVGQNAENHLLNPEELRAKIHALLGSSNDPEKEIDFRRTCLINQENSISSSELNEAYQEYIKAYHQSTSLYFTRRIDNRAHLIIYDTENETEEVKVLETSEILDFASAIVHLPNGELFCFGYGSYPGITVIIDSTYRVRVLPRGEPCYNSSGIYYNRNIYCFGGLDYTPYNLSSRFDLDNNQWIKLAPMPKADSGCKSVLFNGNILISGYGNKNLLRYSIELDSFSTIPYDFVENESKVLISLEGRLYLIGCSDYWLIYQSEIGDENAWMQIATSTIRSLHPMDCWTYNKGGIYIGCVENNGWTDPKNHYYKFSLDEKVVTELRN